MFLNRIVKSAAVFGFHVRTQVAGGSALAVVLVIAGGAIMGLGMVSTASAAIIANASAPTLGTYDVGKTTYISGRDNNGDDEIQQRPAQLFTTKSDLASYVMPSFALQNRTTNPSGMTGMIVEIRNSSWDLIASQTYTVPTLSANNNWLTLTFDSLTWASPAMEAAYKDASTGYVTLAASTTYIVDVYKSGAYLLKWQNSNENTVPATSVWSNNGHYTGDAGRDRLFVANLVAVPEPASVALLGLGGLLMLPRRRRA